MYTSLFLAATAAVAAKAQSLTDVLGDQTDTLSDFATFAQRAGLVDTINDLDSVTVFAPTNDAFADVLDAYPNLLRGDDNNTTTTNNTSLTDTFINVLRYHVVPGSAVAVGDVPPFPGAFLPSALDSYVVNPYLEDTGNVAVFSAEKRMSNVVSAGIEFDGGIIHTIDSVLLPPNPPSETAQDMGFLYFYGALQSTDLVEDVDTADGITVFIPRDQAFIDVGGALPDLFGQELSTLLQYHVVPQVLYTTNLTDGDELNTLAQTPYENGLDVTVNEDDGALYIDNARVITADILLSNGIAHLIDQVMNPATDSDDGYDYDVRDGEGAGVPAFEDVASATLPALTSGIEMPSSTFSPTGTFTAVSGAGLSYEPKIYGGLFGLGALAAFFM